jgi:hypothetical protein
MAAHPINDYYVITSRRDGYPDRWSWEIRRKSKPLGIKLAKDGFQSKMAAQFAGKDDDMSDKLLSRERYGEAFWRAHHEAWRHSELNQREYCEAQGFRSRRSATGGRSSKPSPSRRRPSCSTGAAT